MAISTYSEIKQSIIRWSHRSDLDTLIDDFIRLAEVDMFKTTSDHEGLEIREMETKSTASADTQELALPTGFLSMRSMVIGDDDLRYLAPESMQYRNGTGKPLYYTITNQIEFDISPDQAYTVEMVYFAKPTGLSSSNTTNVVLTNHPDIYLYGALWILFTHAMDDENISKYRQFYTQAIDGANAKDEWGRYGSAPYARVNGPTP